jgi:hypothetical protein
MGIYNKHTVERVKYNNDDPEKQILIEDLYESKHSILGVFKWSFNKEYYADIPESSKNKNLGFK